MTSYTQNNITLYCTANDPKQNHRMAHIHGKNPVRINQTNCNDCVTNLTNKYNCCTKQINQNIHLSLIHDNLHRKQQYTVPPMITNETTEWPVSMVRIQLELTKPTAMTMMNLTNKYNCCTK